MKLEKMKKLEPGESFVYYTGACIAREECKEKYLALEMYIDGLVELTQRKITFPMKIIRNGTVYETYSNGYDYIMTRKKCSELPYLANRRKTYYRGLSNYDL